MKKLSRMGKALVVGAATLVLLAQSATAMPITVDDILSQGDTTAAYLSGKVWMDVSGRVLTITLQNTSGDAAGSGAGVLLTGIGFNLPGAITVRSGSAIMGSTTIPGTTGTSIGFIKPSDGNVSQEWGFDTAGLDSGALLGHGVNNAVSTMESQTTKQFQPGSLVPPPNLNGPDMGLASISETDAFGNGVEGIRDTVTVTLNLSAAYAGDLLAFIESGNVVLTFGSPDAGGTPPGVADGGSTLVLLGGSLLGLGWFSRRRQKVTAA